MRKFIGPVFSGLLMLPVGITAHAEPLIGSNFVTEAVATTTRCQSTNKNEEVSCKDLMQKVNVAAEQVIVMTKLISDDYVRLAQAEQMGAVKAPTAELPKQGKAKAKSAKDVLASTLGVDATTDYNNPVRLEMMRHVDICSAYRVQIREIGKGPDKAVKDYAAEVTDRLEQVYQLSDICRSIPVFRYEGPA